MISTDAAKAGAQGAAMEAKFSLPFCLAAALLDGKVVMETFTDERLQASAERQLMQRVRPRAEPALSQYGAFAARVTVRMTDGRSVAACAARNLWDDPGVAASEKRRQLLSKYAGCAARVLTDAQIAETISIVDALEDQTGLARLLDIARADSGAPRLLPAWPGFAASRSAT